MPDEDEGVMNPDDGPSSTIVHLAGPTIKYQSLQRQRCSWCGFILVDDDLSRMAVALNEDGSMPEQGPGGFPFETFIEVTLAGGFRGSTTVDVEEHEDGSIKVPDNCCMRLPAEMTGEKEHG